MTSSSFHWNKRSEKCKADLQWWAHSWPVGRLSCGNVLSSKKPLHVTPRSLPILQEKLHTLAIWGRVRARWSSAACEVLGRNTAPLTQSSVDIPCYSGLGCDSQLLLRKSQDRITGTVYSIFFHQNTTVITPHKVYLFPKSTVYQHPPSQLCTPKTRICNSLGLTHIVPCHRN